MSCHRFFALDLSEGLADAGLLHRSSGELSQASDLGPNIRIAVRMSVTRSFPPFVASIARIFAARRSESRVVSARLVTCAKSLSLLWVLFEKLRL